MIRLTTESKTLAIFKALVNIKPTLLSKKYRRMIIKLDNRYYGTIFFYTILLFLIVLGVTMILKSNFDIRTIIGFSFSIVLEV